MSSSKTRLDSEKLKKLSEQSPVRRSSITRIASSVVDAIKSQTGKLGGQGKDTESEMGDKDSINENINFSEKKSLTNFFANKKITGSFKSGSGGGSVVTSLSDLERIEKIMNNAQYANKSIVKYFCKHLEDFRREM